MAAWFHWILRHVHVRRQATSPPHVNEETEEECMEVGG